MKLTPLPALTQGVDVLTPEGDLKKGAVRKAVNVSIHDNGGFDRRPGYELLTALIGAHSLWRSPAQTCVLAAAGDTLYDVDLTLAAATALFIGLTPDNPIEYTEIGPDVFFVDGTIVRRITPSGLVRRPGVADLVAERPTLTATVGGLYPGRYGVAYSLLSDTGEESGLSGIEWIELTTGGIAVSAIANAPHVSQANLYVTPPNGTKLYLHQTITWSATSSITDQTKTRLATGKGLSPIPGGDYVRYYRGRLYVVQGAWVWISEPLHYGLVDIQGAHLTFGRTITLFEPVETGIFVGFRERVMFLRGTGPENFEPIPLAERGAIAHTGTNVSADFFDPEVVPDRGNRVAAWLSDRGMAIGRADGTMVLPQASRISLVADRGRGAFMLHGGVRQVAYCLESLTLGNGGGELTDFSFIEAVGRSIGDSDAKAIGRRVKFPKGVGESYGRSQVNGAGST